MSGNKDNMEHLFTFLTSFYFCCLIILLCTNKIIRRDKQIDLSRIDLYWNWYLYLENRWLIPINLFLVILFLLLAFALKEWI